MHGAVESGLREAQRIIDWAKKSGANTSLPPTTPLYIVIAILTLLLITFIGLAAVHFHRKKIRKWKVFTISKTVSDLNARQA